MLKKAPFYQYKDRIVKSIEDWERIYNLDKVERNSGQKEMQKKQIKRHLEEKILRAKL